MRASAVARVDVRVSIFINARYQHLSYARAGGINIYHTRVGSVRRGLEGLLKTNVRTMTQGACRDYDSRVQRAWKFLWQIDIANVRTMTQGSNGPGNFCGK